VIKSEGINVLEGVRIRVVQDRVARITLVISARPTGPSYALLEDATGGGIVF